MVANPLAPQRKENGSALKEIDSVGHEKNNLVRFKNWNTPPHFVALPQAKLCEKKQKTCLCWDNSLILGKTHQCLLLLRFLCFWVYRK